MCVLLEVKLLFEFPAKLDRTNDELDVRGSIMDVFIGWVGSGEKAMLKHWLRMQYIWGLNAY